MRTFSLLLAAVLGAIASPAICLSQVYTTYYSAAPYTTYYSDTAYTTYYSSPYTTYYTPSYVTYSPVVYESAPAYVTSYYVAPQTSYVAPQTAYYVAPQTAYYAAPQTVARYTYQPADTTSAAQRTAQKPATDGATTQYKVFPKDGEIYAAAPDGQVFMLDTKSQEWRRVGNPIPQLEPVTR